MTLEELLTNLDRTIKNKQTWCDTLGYSQAETLMREVLRINLDELRLIRADVVKIMETSK